VFKKFFMGLPIAGRRKGASAFAEPAFSPGAENKIIIIKTMPRGKRIATENPDKGELHPSRYPCLEFILPAMKAALWVE
jgi:hypothetical protein